MKKRILAVLVVLAVIAVGVKTFFFPSVMDAWFEMDRNVLLKVPPGLVVFRSTHFHDNLDRRLVFAPHEYNGHEVRWVMGRDLPLRVAIAVAYNANRGAVVLPTNAPNGHFDFLVTVLGDVPARLQAAIRHKLGLIAQWETVDTPVFAIKVVDFNLSALAVSAPAEKPDVEYRKHKLYYTHIQISELADTFERTMDMPVLNETGLTNYYDFSVPWDGEMEQRIRFEATSRAAIDKMLNGIGLMLQATNEPAELLVVKRI